jgi:hypothetical protein
MTGDVQIFKMHAIILINSGTVGWDSPSSRAISLKLLGDYLPTAAIMTFSLFSVRTCVHKRVLHFLSQGHCAAIVGNP